MYVGFLSFICLSKFQRLRCMENGERVFLNGYNLTVIFWLGTMVITFLFFVGESTSFLLFTSYNSKVYTLF